MSIVSKFIFKRHKSETATQIGLTYEPQIFKVNELENIKRKILHTMAAKNLEIETNIRKEYDGLVYDLKKRINEEKRTFIERRKLIYQTILDVLRKDYSLENPNGVGSSFGSTQEKNQKILDNLKKEGEDLKKKIKILRIIRIMKLIAMNKSFERKLQVAEGDRKVVNGSLWSNRLQYEMHGAEMEEQLLEAQDRLCECELNLETAKHQLQVQKSSNIDMVQWKATNANKVVDLKKEIDKVRLSKDAPNIGQLLKKLEAAQEELDLLIEETDAIDNERQESVTSKLNQIERVKTSMAQTRISRLSILENAKFEKSQRQLDTSSEDAEKAMKLSEENSNLRKTNEQMKREIAYYTEIMQRQSKQTMKYLESTLIPANRPKTSAIIKPVTTKATSRSVNSRIETKKRILPNVFI